MSFVHEHPNFKNFIRGVLAKAELSDKYIDILTDEKCMEEFTKAFTHKTVNPVHNYEYYEILGDATTNKIVVWYYHRRFPQLFENPGGGNMGPVAIMARLKQVGISKRTYSSFSNSLGFWDYVRVVEDAKKGRTKILEDVFESFVGCLEYLIDMKVMEYSGYGIAYIFMSKIMDKINIKLDREALYDQKSKLNEDINSFKGALKIEYQSLDRAIGNPLFLEDRSNISKRFETRVIIHDTRDGKIYRSSPGYGSNKPEAEQSAAKHVRDSGIIDKLRYQK